MSGLYLFSVSDASPLRATRTRTRPARRSATVASPTRVYLIFSGESTDFASRPEHAPRACKVGGRIAFLGERQTTAVRSVCVDSTESSGHDVRGRERRLRPVPG